MPFEREWQASSLEARPVAVLAHALKKRHRKFMMRGWNNESNLRQGRLSL